MANQFEIQIRDLATGQYLSNAVLPQRADTPKEGRDLMVPVLFSPQSNLEFSFTNLIAETNTVIYCRYGVKMFL